MLKKYSTEFSMTFDEILVPISYSTLQLLIPPKLLNMTQSHQIMCGYERFVHAVTYQEYINHWHKQRLSF